MSYYDEYQKTKETTSTNSGGYYSEYLKSKEPPKIKTSFKERLTGAPTKQSDGTYTANTGILPFLGGLPKATFDVGKSLVQGTINTGKNLGESIAVNTGAFDALNNANQQNQDIALNLTKRILADKKLGKNTSNLETALQGLQPKDTIESLAPNSQKSNLQALGDVAMMATEMIMPGEAGVGGTAGKLLARKTIKQVVLSKTKSEAEKMLAKKTLFNIFSGYGYDVGSKLSEGKTNKKEVLSPGVATLLAAIFSGAETKSILKSAGLNESKILGDRALLKANFGDIPTAGTPPPGYWDKSLTALPAPRKPGEIPIELPGEGILGSAEKLRNSASPTQSIVSKTKTPEVIRAEKFNSKQDFINNEMSFYTKTKQKVPNNLVEKSGKAWDNAHTTPKDPPIKPLEPNTPPIASQQVDNTIPNQTSQQVDNTISKTETPLTDNMIKESSPEYKAKIETGAKRIAENNPDVSSDLPFLREQSKLANDFIDTNGVDNSIKILEDGGTLPGNLRPDSLHSILSNIADNTNDGNLIMRVIELGPKIPGTSAQNLGANRLKNPDSAYYAVKDIMDSFQSKKGFLIKKIEESNKKTTIKQLKNWVEQYKNSVENIGEVLDNIICK